MREFILSGVVALIPSIVSAAEFLATSAQVKGVAFMQPEQVAPATRRCAFNGQLGSFHLIGEQGTGAYRLGNGRFVASLTASGQDAHYWYYAPTQNGDQFTTMWAFARQPDCGRYWVWRQDRSGWHRFEATDAWGGGLTEPASASATANAVERLQIDMRDLKTRVRILEQRSATP